MQVDYEHCFQYRYDPRDGLRYPILSLKLVNPDDPARRIRFDAYLDSGCRLSLLDARLALAVGLDPTHGRPLPFTSATGASMTGIVRSARLFHPALGSLDLEVGFSQFMLARNLLGRDFLDHVQLGIREHHQEFYLTSER